MCGRVWKRISAYIENCVKPPNAKWNFRPRLNGNKDANLITLYYVLFAQEKCSREHKSNSKFNFRHKIHGWLLIKFLLPRVLNSSHFDVWIVYNFCSFFSPSRHKVVTWLHNEKRAARRLWPRKGGKLAKPNLKMYPKLDHKPRN